ncbi:hypothetical protein BDDG_13488 [Blastomyces dermatitidis ATCC 18188]|uniref:Uncharacterized protein n=1 Tax=Ajellomyces dermatitidis (strain ATCC 18188 / CBS 674.68) TaxID=653446 RepID=A0A0J9ETG4_AJEDA|nr:hypothetical protein BDFG_07157 [Blastomyces dermatitidis ATCC 26199]KMW69332.1 hypothetical protein BDDG_13488 [Blastomyces dermatitidis ATCC 18188]
MADQADRFDVMCVTFANVSDLAKNQAEQITQLTQKLINAATICKLRTQGNATKKKILQDNELNTSQTVKTNFMLLFELSKHSEYYSKRTKYSKKLNTVRFQTVHELCESYHNAVITLSMSYSTVAWMQSSVEVFDSLIKMLKKNAEKEEGVN